MIPKLDHLSPAEGDAYLRVLGEQHEAREARKRAKAEADYEAEFAAITALNLDGTAKPEPVETPTVEDADAPTSEPPVEPRVEETPANPAYSEPRVETSVGEPARDALHPHCAPGCFGSAHTYKHGSAECSPCPFAPQCAPLSAERRAYVRAKNGLDGATADPELSPYHVAACRRAGEVVSRDVGRDTENKSKWRAKRKAATPEPTKPPVLAPFKLTMKEEMDRRKPLLDTWLKTDGPAQRKQRPRFVEILKCFLIFQKARLSLGRDPTPTEFGRRLVGQIAGVTLENATSAGQTRIKMLRRLEQPGGPWEPRTSDMRQNEAEEPRTSDMRQSEPGNSIVLSALTTPEG